VLAVVSPIFFILFCPFRANAAHTINPIVMLWAIIDRPFIEAIPGISDEKSRIAGHRITVQDMAIWHDRIGKSVDV